MRERAKEQVLQSLWYSGLAEAGEGGGLKTSGGKALRVVFPGWWAPSGGPDFRRAKVVMDGSQVLMGDVEVHVLSSDWFGHGHESDPEYGEVILHVVLWNDAPGKMIRTHDGRCIEQLEMGPQVKASLDGLSETLDVDDLPMPERAVPGPCSVAVGTSAGMARAEGVLDSVGGERVLGKALRMRRRMEESSPDQAVFEALMEACGYRSNKVPFLMLSRRLPVKVCAGMVKSGGEVLELESAFMGASGFLEEFCERRRDVDEESREYLCTVEKKWKVVAGKRRLMPLARSIWKLRGTRPKNYPPKRFAAIGQLLARVLPESLSSALMNEAKGAFDGRRLCDSFAALFECNGGSYWCYRDAFGGYRARRAQSLVGKERAGVMLSNAVVPHIVAIATRGGTGVRKKNAMEFLRTLPACDDSITRFMKRRIFGGMGEAKKAVKNALRQQGLHALYERCYRKNGDSCDGCAMWEAVKS